LSHFFSQAALSQGLSHFFSQAALSQGLSHFFSQAALSQGLSQGFSQGVAQAFWQESGISQVLEQAFWHSFFAAHSVVALSQATSLAFLLQQEVTVRTVTATIANNTFFIMFFLS
jgi:hypothetical protein